MFDLRRLAVFAAVVEAGSISAAAAQLSYTPSAVSQQVRKLEAEVGQPLLHRVPRGVLPTEAGDVLATHAGQILRQMAAAETDLAQLAGLRKGALTIGTFPTMGNSLLPLVVTRFRERYPDVRLSVHSGRREDLLGLIADGTLGLSLLWDYGWCRLDDSNLTLIHLFDDPTVLVVRPDHWAAKRREVAMAELADEAWISRAQEHPVAQVVERGCRAAGFQPRIAFQANDDQEVEAMVSVGLGIALAPLTAVLKPHPDVRVLRPEIVAPAASRRILIGHRRSRVTAPVNTAMRSLIIEEAQRLCTWDSGKSGHEVCPA